METSQHHPVSQLDWLLDDLVLRVPHIEQAAFLSQDGLALGASRGLDRADAEHLAALAAGFQSLARGAGRHFGGGEVRQTIIEMTSGFLFVTAAGQGTCLAVLTGAEADVGLVAYEMAVLVQRTGDHLQVNTRTPSALSDSWEEIGDAVQRRAVAGLRGRSSRPALRPHPGSDAAFWAGV
jgi:predicted regulator of Ras-like GTPase activity (Roadblock/LC7/MglB family)